MNAENAEGKDPLVHGMAGCKVLLLCATLLSVCRGSDASLSTCVVINGAAEAVPHLIFRLGQGVCVRLI